MVIGDSRGIKENFGSGGLGKVVNVVLQIGDSVCVGVLECDESGGEVLYGNRVF